jgi:hypothetical protein
MIHNNNGNKIIFLLKNKKELQNQNKEEKLYKNTFFKRNNIINIQKKKKCYKILFWERN